MKKLKRPYQPPTIVKAQSAHHSKIGLDNGETQRVRTEIDGVSIESLCDRHGSPLFVFSQRTLEEKYDTARRAFGAHYPDVTFAWSYKTNYVRGICQFFHDRGSLAEVVSEFEYEKARAIGVPGEKIIFNGPLKSHQALRQAVEEKAMIHIDHLSEIDQLERISADLGRPIPVAIRVNLNAGVQPQWTRFGFNLESGQALDAVRRITLHNHLKLVGLHTHIGTFILDPNCYATAARKMCELAGTIARQYGIEVKYLDLGGGFPSLSHLMGIYQPPDVLVPPIEAYAKAIGGALKQHLPPSLRPHLYLEAGRHLVDEAGFLVTTVQARSIQPDGVPTYVLDAGVNLLYTGRWYRFNFEVDRELPGPTEYSILHGPLCMNIDVVCDYLTFPSLPQGTRLTLHPVGAYNLTQSMQFIQYRPAVVMVRRDGTVSILKERESLETVERDELLAHIQNGKLRKVA